MLGSGSGRKSCGVAIFVMHTWNVRRRCAPQRTRFAIFFFLGLAPRRPGSCTQAKPKFGCCSTDQRHLPARPWVQDAAKVGGRSDVDAHPGRRCLETRRPRFDMGTKCGISSFAFPFGMTTPLRPLPMEHGMGPTQYYSRTRPCEEERSGFVLAAVYVIACSSGLVFAHPREHPPPPPRPTPALTAAAGCAPCM